MVMSTSQKKTVTTCFMEAVPTIPADAVAAARVGSSALLNCSSCVMVSTPSPISVLRSPAATVTMAAVPASVT